MDELGILDAIADDQRLGGQTMGECYDQFGFRSGLETIIVLFTELDDAVDHLRLLVHLDRKDAAIGAFVAHPRDGLGKAFVQMRDLMFQIGADPQHHRRLDPPVIQIGQNAGQADRCRVGIQRIAQTDFALLCHLDEAFAPFLNPVDGMRCVGRLFQSSQSFDPRGAVLRLPIRQQFDSSKCKLCDGN